MKDQFVIAVVLGLIISSQGVFAQNSSMASDDQNHVTIVVNQSGQKSSLKKAFKKTAIKKSSKKIVAVRKVQKKVQKKVVLAPVPVPVVSNTHRVPGPRVTLANPSSARANLYTNNEPNETIGPIQSSTDFGVGNPSIAKKIKQDKAAQSKSYWEITYKTLDAANINAYENYGTGLDYTIQAWDRLFITYYFQPDISLGVIGQYYHTWFQDQDRPQSTTNPGLTQSYASYLGDTGLVFTDKKIATLAGGIVFSGAEAFYTPTSQASQTAGMYGQDRTTLSLGKSIGKVDLKWNEILWYDFQQYSTNAYLSTSGAVIANPQYYVLSNVDITYNFTKKLSFGLETGFINESNYGDSYSGTPQTYNDYVELNPELDYTFSKTFMLGLGIWEVYNMTTQPVVSGQTVSYYTPFAPYNGTSPGYWTSSQVYLVGAITF